MQEGHGKSASGCLSAGAVAQDTAEHLHSQQMTSLIQSKAPHRWHKITYSLIETGQHTKVTAESS